MADWKQITARIRRARSGKDPLGQLSNLYEKTSDAMVAFELAKLFENSGQNSDAAKWYSTAAERFRRSEWKTKSQEAAARLGGAPTEIVLLPADQPTGESQLTFSPAAPDKERLTVEQNPEALESAVAVSSEIQEATAQSAGPAPEAKRGGRRRGRRGGRNRRGSSASSGSGGQLAGGRTANSLEPSESSPSPARGPGQAMPSLPVEPPGEATGSGIKGRYGDPGLSSRISLLEMQFRRLLACPPAKLSDADRAPAGPGVLVLTDSDLTTYYYVEACQTLRIAAANLIRGGNRKGADSIKPRLADHLEIPEARVAKYLADHCVVRWLQLDEGASNFAHFVIAVLRPVLND